jgi:PKHD-type hydroxylase
MWELDHKISDYCTQTPPDWLTSYELDEVIKLGNSQKIEQALIGSLDGIVENADVRRTQLQYINPTQDSQWLYRKLTDIIKQVNGQFFNYNLDVIETLQFSTYNIGDFYSTHLDSLPFTKWGKFRKLSFSLQLNDPLEYTGGDLIINGKVISRQRGSIAFFNSFVSHSVTPIKGGVRKTLVGWVLGPKFI